MTETRDPLRWQPYRDGLKQGEKVLWRRPALFDVGCYVYGCAEWIQDAPLDDDGPCWFDPDDSFAVYFNEFIPYPEEKTP